MAGTARAGSTSASVADDVIGRTPGMTRGTIPFAQWQALIGLPTPVLATFVSPPGSGARTGATQGSSPAKSIVGRAGSTSDNVYVGGDWFEKVHLLPRAPEIAFGNILTLVQRDYEIYNAFRETDLTITAVTNNALPGVNLPEATPVITLRRQTSFFNSATTDNSGTSGLGTIVKTTADATQDGLPTFDTDIIFDVSPPGNDVVLLVSGTRLVLMTFEYEAPVNERMAFLTDTIEALDGREQRLALRKNPRQQFKVIYRLIGNERQRMQVLLFDWIDNSFGLPLWHEKVTLTSATSVGATLYPVAGALDVDFRVGGLAAVITDDATFDVINIVSVTDTLITGSDPSLNAYPAGTSIMPVRVAVITGAQPGSRAINTLETIRVDWEVLDNDTGALTGDSTPGFWSTYNSRVLFDDCNVVEGDMAETFRRRTYLVDNSTGLITISSSWDRNKREHMKGFVLRNRAEILEFRKLMLDLHGSQKPFWIPTFIEDLTANAPLVLGASTIDVDAINYKQFVRERLPMTVFRITFTDDTNLVRIILSSATISGTVEQLTLDTTWPANRTVAEIVRIEFYELVRFATDRIELVYPRIGLAEVSAPVIRVFDDN